MRLRVDGGLRAGELGERVFFARYGGEHGGFAAAPIFLAKGRAHGQLPVGKGVFVVAAERVVLQDVAQNGDVYVVNRGALASDDFHAVALAFGRYADFAVEIAFGFYHVARVIGRVFGEVAQLLPVQFFFALVSNQRQMLLQHGLDFGVVGFDDDGVFGGEFFFVFFVGLLAFAFVFARGDFGFF